jgi:hypothetical protein
MADLSALTPPFLMAAVVIAAIVAFLRHELRRGRADRARQDDIPAATPDEAGEPERTHPDGADATAAAQQDR